MKQLSASGKASTGLILFFLTASVLTSFAQVTEEWVKRYSHFSEDRAAAIAVGKNGNIYVSGRSGDDVVAKCYSPAGDTLGTVRYEVSGSIATWGMLVDDSNYVYMTGYQYAAWPTGSQAIVIKSDPMFQNPNMWLQHYSISSAGKAIALDDSLNIYATGECNGEDVFTFKLNQNAWGRWTKVSNFGFYDCGIEIMVDHSRHAYVLAISKNSTNSYSDFLLIKYDPDGDTMWTARYNGNGYENKPASLKLDDDGNIYMSGTIYSGPDEKENFVVLKYDSSGNRKWLATYNGPGNYIDQVAYMCLDDSANVFVAGTSAGTTSDLAVVKYDSSGNRKWAGRFDYNNSNNDAKQLCVDRGGNVYVIGNIVKENGDEDYETVKFDRDGNLEWNISYGSPGSVWDRPVAIAVDSISGVYVTGSSADGAGGYDWLTIKYSQQPVGVKHPAVSEGFLLMQNYPNPFTKSTTITWQLPEKAHVVLKVYDFAGRELETLVDCDQIKGDHKVIFNASGLPVGMYLVRIRANDFSEAKRICIY
jgi:hypothetical protein